MVFAKIYCVSIDFFASICGDDFLDYEAVLPYQENEFTKDNSLILQLNSDTTRLSPKNNSYESIELNVKCRYFTSEEIEKLEAKSNKENLTDDATTKHLHLIIREDELKRLSSGQIVNVDLIPTKLCRIILTATYDKNLIEDPSCLVHNSQHLRFEDEECYVGKKSTESISYKGTDVQIELKVVDCEPVSQGIADRNSRWVILDSSRSLQKAEKLVTNECNDDQMTITEMHDVFNKQVHLSKQSLLIAGFASPLKELWSDCPQDQTVQLKIEVNYWNTLHHSFTNSFKNKWELDINDTHCLYVSMDMLSKLGVQNGCWIKVCIQEGPVYHTNSEHKIKQPENRYAQSPETCLSEAPGDVDNSSSSLKRDGNLSDKFNEADSHYRYAQVFVIHPTSKALDIYLPENQQVHVLSMKDYINKTKETVHISPLLLFNLLDGNPCTTNCNELYLNLTTETRLSVSPNISSTSSMPFAQDAHLSLINTPFSKPSDTFDESLKRYFSNPRLLKVGDVLCVDFDATKDGVDSVMSEEWYSLNSIYFKVKKLVVGGRDEKCCLVDMLNSTVYQSMSVHSFVPIGLQPAKDLHHKGNYWASTSPSGLHTPTSELISIINPYLRQHVNLMPAVLLTGQVGVGKSTVVNAVATNLGLCVININCYDLIGESVAATESRINNLFQKATSCRPCILLLRNINTLVKDREGLEEEPRLANTLQQCIATLKDLTAWPVVVIATTSSTAPLSAQMYSCFLHEVNISTPSEAERKEILEALAATSGSVAPDVSFGLVAKRTAGLVLADLVALFTKATNVAYERISDDTSEDVQNEVQGFELNKQVHNKMECSNEGDEKLRDIIQAGVISDQRFHSEINQSENIHDERFHSDENSSDQRFNPETHQTRNIHDQPFHLTINEEDFDRAIEIMRAEHSDAIGAPKIPNVSWQDIGGLLDVKEELLDTIQLPLQHPELFASGLRRSGVLLYGPPGTGKTLLAKAVATECSLNFLSVKGPELINMYVGQSEENIRQVFSRAQSATPCVIFFDELDSLAPNRGRSGDSGGVMDRVVSQLLAELDGLHKSHDVFVIGATNRPDLLDPALLRPGRFDKLLYLGISEDHDAQLKILKALTNKFVLDDDCNLEAISQHCPLNFTGADLYALCSDAMLHAMKRVIADNPDLDSEVTASVKVREEDFLEAVQTMTPSVAEHELQRYKTIQQQLRT